MTVHRTRQVVVVMAIVVSALLTGCASIPDRGSVRTLDSQIVRQGSTVRYNPPGPVDGASPDQVVAGFLEAMIAFPVTTRTASQFLTPEAAAAWRTHDRTVIYNAPRVSAEATDVDAADGDRDRATLRYTRRAVLDDQGQYTAATGHASIPIVLQRVGGQWRITNPPPGLLISQQYFDDYFQPLSLYYLDPGGEELVASPVYVPSGDQLATTLLSGLLRRPDDAGGAELATVVPEGTTLTDPAPVRSDGTVDVNLSGDLAVLTTRRRELLSAQIVSTLAQVPGVTAVRIRANGAPLAIPGVDDAQAVGLWDDLLATGTNDDQIFALRARRLVVVSGGVSGSFAGTWGEQPHDVIEARIKVGPGTSKIAAVLPGRRGVRVAGLAPQPEVKDTIAYSGRDVATPDWDSTGRLWVVDRGPRGSSLTVLDEDSGPSQAGLGRLARQRVVSFELSPDDARFVAVAHRPGRPATQAYVGAIRYTSDGSVAGIGDLHVLPLARYGLRAPAAVTWRSPTNVAVLAADRSRSIQPYLARIDGSSVAGGSLTGEPLLPDIAAVTIAGSGSGDAPLYVGDAAGRVWVQDSLGRWQQVDSRHLTSAHYPR